VADKEQDWIAKYRAAVTALPVRQSRAEILVARLQETMQRLVSAIGKIARDRTAVLHLKPWEYLSRPMIAEAVTPVQNPQNRSDGPSKQRPGSQHLSGRNDQRKAS
jgi:hypothetical protein